MLPWTLTACSLLLCMLGLAGSHFWGIDRQHHVETVLHQNCHHLAFFLPRVCGTVPLAPACCGLISLLSFCSPSCRGRGQGRPTPWSGDGNVCEALRLTARDICRGPIGYDLPCRELHDLMDLICNPYVFFPFSNEYGGPSILHATFPVNVQPPPPPPPPPQPLSPSPTPSLPSSPPPPPEVTQPGEGENGGDGGDSVNATMNDGGSYELPELADCELTGLINDSQSELKVFELVQELIDCNSEDKLRYRTIDGSCNNLQNPTWGKSFEPQIRLLPSQLVNGTFPRTRGKSGNPLPLARAVSRVVSPMMDVFSDVSNMVMAWGQFIDHDFTGTPITKNGTMSFECCGNISDDLKVENGGPCFPIPIPPGDPLGRDCMEFVRSLPFSLPNGTVLVPREQINALTAFLDASAVYGSTLEELDAIKGNNGKMKVIQNNMLPENPAGTCTKEIESDYCLLAGDKRANVFVGLGMFHTAFVREHNRIVDVFHDLNPHWDDDRLFQEARKIVSAQFQHLTYVQWLPLILDDVTLTKFRLKPGDFLYDRRVDPSVANVFSTAAFRFGHSQVKQIVKIGQMIRQLQDTLMRPTYVLNNMVDVIRGLAMAPTDVVDRFLADGLVNHMFETSAAAMDGLDLLSLNIQRGRDHGLPPLNDFREFCGLERITFFNSSELTLNLSGLYESPEDVDVFVGMIIEKHRPGALVGPTFACLLATQFQAMKFGDRFFYETSSRPEGFTSAQRKEVQKVTLSKILCDTNPDLDKIQIDIFSLEDESNPKVPCNQLPGIDLSKWKEKQRRYFN